MVVVVVGVICYVCLREKRDEEIDSFGTQMQSHAARGNNPSFNSTTTNDDNYARLDLVPAGSAGKLNSDNFLYSCSFSHRLFSDYCEFSKPTKL